VPDLTIQPPHHALAAYVVSPNDSGPWPGGGAFALYLAAGHGFSVSAVNYGAVPKDIETIVEGACPIIGSFGTKDRTLRGAAARLEQALSRRCIDHDVKEYPDAGLHFSITAAKSCSGR
jgi:dienelactone hydrolase